MDEKAINCVVDIHGVGLSHTHNQDVPAIQVKKGYKCYKGPNGNKRPVLYNMNMNVPKGCIYSLLGSSGCGKTTLLSCIVGLKQLDSGEIFINGKKHGEKGSLVPGKGVGFMPQDIALYGDFSIAEVIQYFGNLNGMSGVEVEERKNFLLNLLSLPDEHKRINTLSGGQKRRTSMAVTLIHDPPLIFLDEPTVGVDYILRKSIWNYLVKLVKEKGTTIVVTTHYIDEVTHSAMVGVMRGGRLLAEKSPNDLYAEFNTENLEDIILQLCEDDEQKGGTSGRERSSSSGNILSIDIVKDVEDALRSRKQKCNDFKKCVTFDLDFEDVKESVSRVKSLTMKNFAVMLRSILLLLFAMGMPALLVAFMGMSIGGDPKPMRVGVVSSEGCDQSKVTEMEFGCYMENLSCRYLANLPKDVVELSYYQNVEDARNHVIQGDLKGYLKFPENFSQALVQRSSGGLNVDDDTIENSMITFDMDASNAVITNSLKKFLIEAYLQFSKGILSDCGMNPDIGGLPFKMENPVYGSYDMSLQQFVSCGMLIGVALFFPLASSTITFLWDKNAGTIERARVSGTKSWEILMSYFISEGCVLIIQAFLCLIIFITVFQVRIVGSVHLAFGLIVLNGFAGISLGLLLASICNREVEAILLAIAIMMPNFFMAGAIWPVEAMPYLLQKLSYVFPASLGNEGLRCIIFRGWGLTQSGVWAGFASACGWIGLYWVVNIYVCKYRHTKS